MDKFNKVSLYGEIPTVIGPLNTHQNGTGITENWGLGWPCMYQSLNFRSLEHASIVPSTAEFWAHEVIFNVIFTKIQRF